MLFRAALLPKECIHKYSIQKLKSGLLSNPVVVRSFVSFQHLKDGCDSIPDLRRQRCCRPLMPQLLFCSTFARATAAWSTTVGVCATASNAIRSRGKAGADSAWIFILVSVLAYIWRRPCRSRNIYWNSVFSMFLLSSSLPLPRSSE